MSNQWISLCQLDVVPQNTGKYVVVEKHGYAVFVVNNEVRVIDDNCPHAGASLSGGMWMKKVWCVAQCIIGILIRVVASVRIMNVLVCRRIKAV